MIDLGSPTGVPAGWGIAELDDGTSRAQLAVDPSSPRQKQLQQLYMVSGAHGWMCSSTVVFV